MIKFENAEVFNIPGAIRGMRNPLNSWHLSDSGVVEEIADVYIMLAQLEVIYDIDIIDLYDVISYKLNRQCERMKAGI